MKFDAIILGAGPSGAAAALALAKQGRSVAIVERSEFPRRKVCGEFISAVNLQILDSLGVGSEFRALGGPEVRRIALFASGPSIEAPMPRAHGEAFGRALGRDVLDCLLRDAARRAGVTVFQPWRAVEIAGHGDRSRVTIETRRSQETLIAPVIIAAHGSWEPGKLVSNLEKRHDRSDFLGFKAHFSNASLPADLMPLLVFPGGYGGMVWSDGGRLSLSCCMRRDALDTVRRSYPGLPAAAAVHAHILASCPAAADAIGGASLHGEWLAAGPIRPGIRERYKEDVFRVGNLAGESHPIIAEGISMALQSGWMLAQQLSRSTSWGPPERAATARKYSAAWQKQFSTRIHVASFLARLAIFPKTASAMGAFVRVFPASLSIGAALSGKTRPLLSQSS
ncbi:NAD(P)/FAD-dependent oxidoreductase [Mesorhizobium sp. INR15]|uniref:NAD(P)/FAD-dependent oxidoreductase n=1 Tax=Mesorhizobium sp. INR15 TaxID=2654248 RepID=UPI0018966F60|nr:FAD-dependent monooxygenase [Mesorhizobium sp. INR15]QPC95959.1 FAD-dependent oxidoreductase [Mesorhizobium sp. INR15]